MLLTTLLESAAPQVPTFFVGLGALVILMGALGWVIAMGMGRPHNK